MPIALSKSRPSGAVIASLDVRNLSVRKGLYRRDALARLAERVCEGEGARPGAEVSVLFCDDALIHELNLNYRSVDRPTDVLSFSQELRGGAVGAYPLGDIVISLETVERQCGGERGPMRDEALFLFCHGMLHLLGYDHATRADENAMRAKQAFYLGIPVESAWREDPSPRAVLNGQRRRKGGFAHSTRG